MLQIKASFSNYQSSDTPKLRKNSSIVNQRKRVSTRVQVKQLRIKT